MGLLFFLIGWRDVLECIHLSGAHAFLYHQVNTRILHLSYRDGVHQSCRYTGKIRGSYAYFLSLHYENTRIISIYSLSHRYHHWYPSFVLILNYMYDFPVL